MPVLRASSHPALPAHRNSSHQRAPSLARRQTTVGLSTRRSTSPSSAHPTAEIPAALPTTTTPMLSAETAHPDNQHQVSPPADVDGRAVAGSGSAHTPAVPSPAAPLQPNLADASLSSHSEVPPSLGSDTDPAAPPLKKRKVASGLQPATPQATSTLKRKFKCPSLVRKRSSAVVSRPAEPSSSSTAPSSPPAAATELASSPLRVAKVKTRPGKFKPLTIQAPSAEQPPLVPAAEPPVTTRAAVAPRPALALPKKSRPFVSPVVPAAYDSSTKTPSAPADSPALQRRIQLLKQAIQLLSPAGRQKEQELAASVGRWKAAGREVAQMLWDAGLSADPASRDDGNPFGRSTSPSPCLDDRPKRTSHFSNQGLDDDNGSSNLEAPPDGGTPFSAAEDVAFPAASQSIDDVLRVRPSGTVGYLKEMDQALAHRRAAGATSAGEAVAEEQAEWTMGRMLRVALWTDPSLFGWSDEDGDWADE